MADLSEHERAVRELLLQTRPDAAALSDATINDLVQGKTPTSGSAGPALELNLWPLIEQVFQWIPVVSAIISIVSNSFSIKKALAPEKKRSVAEITDAVMERLRQENIGVTYDRTAIENAVERALH
jgi:hypothetical protein